MAYTLHAAMLVLAYLFLMSIQLTVHHDCPHEEGWKYNTCADIVYSKIVWILILILRSFTANFYVSIFKFPNFRFWKNFSPIVLLFHGPHPYALTLCFALNMLMNVSSYLLHYVRWLWWVMGQNYLLWTWTYPCINRGKSMVSMSLFIDLQHFEVGRKV